MTFFESFRQLHRQAVPLILTNAWDAASAVLFEDLGARAIATSSAGVAWSLGYRDGRKLPPKLSVQVAENILRVIKVPLTVDFENGFSDNPEQVAENVKGLLDAGVAGINLEDGTDDPVLVAKKTEAIKRIAAGRGQNIFINARTDVYLESLVPPEQRLPESIRRGKMFLESGADGFFVPWVKAEHEIAEIVAKILLPLNVLVMPGLPETGQLGKLGVRRVSAGGSVSRNAWGHATSLVKKFIETGDSSVLTDHPLSWDKMQSLFAD